MRISSPSHRPARRGSARLAAVVLIPTLLAVACSSDSSLSAVSASNAQPAGGDTAAAVTTDTADNSAGNGDAATGETGSTDGAASEDAAGASAAGGDDEDAAARRAAIEAVREMLDPGVVFASQQWPTDWSQTTIDVTELRAGLQAFDTRDGIPPLDSPDYQTVGEAADWLTPNDPGALVQIDGQAWFFPLSIMTAHEIVNDTLGSVPVAVTYCPLCNTALAFDRRVGDEVLRFGVSGLLRKSDLVMWDDATTSLWQQITGVGIVGDFAGTQLEVVSTAIVSFEQFAEGFPSGLSLSPDTGVRGSYGRNPYVDYSSRDAPIRGFFVDEIDTRLPALSRVVGVTRESVAQAYPFVALQEERVVNDSIDGTPIAVFWGGSTADALDASQVADGAQIGSAVAYDRTVDGQVLTFVADGDGFRDEETGSTWNLVGQAEAGPLAGASLSTVVHRNEFWFAFAGFFPDATIYGE